MSTTTTQFDTSVNTSLQYDGSLPWLIFWIIFCFPVAMTLFFSSFGFRTNDREVTVTYNGSRLWLCFWTIFLFPVALLLAVLKGFRVTVKS